MRSVFISYRRSDSEGEAGRLFDDLTDLLPDQTVFMDVVAIDPGRDFRKAIDAAISGCSILLAMVGLTWLESKDGAGARRLDDPGDLVRLEIASALRRDIPVVPVLIRGAKMPTAERLPEDLRDLAYRNAVELTHARWKSDVQVLARGLRSQLESGAQGNSVSGDGATGCGHGVEQAVVDRVSKELAGYIGPIAEIVVKRAARRCSSVSELCRVVAEEIEAGSDRQRFLRSCGG